MLQPLARRRGSVGASPTATFATPALLTACALSLVLAPFKPAQAQVQDSPTAPTTPATAPAPGDQTTTTTTTTTQTTTTTNQTPPPPAPEDKPKHRFVIGPEVGVYFPSSSKTSRSFGDSWFTYGVGFGNIQETRTGGRIQFDVSYLSHSQGDSRIDIAPIGLSYRYGLGHSARSGAGPYIGVSGDLFLTQIRNDSEHIVSRIRGTGGGTVFIGTTFSGRGYVQARYYEMGSIRGYDFSGVNLSGGFRF